MLAIEAASMPYMSDSGRHDVMRRLTGEVAKQAKPAPATADDLAAIGIRTEHVPAGRGTARDKTRRRGDG